MNLALVSATDIDQWARTRAAQERLPELVRRLVYSTTRAPTYVDFPAGDAIHLSGVDGAVEIDEEHANIPKGLSVWEMGTDANAKRKADKEYEKRKASPPTTARGMVVPSESTFVFVTPRRWGAKDAWAASRRSEGYWNDVRVLDANDLEAWLQQAPAVHVWLSRVVGRLPSGVDDIEAVWADWAESIRPTATTALILAGRANEVAEISKWLTAGAAGILTVSAESTSDAIGVIAATIVAMPESERTPTVSRTVVVSSRDAFVQLSASREGLIIVPTYMAGDEILRATRGGHQVLLPAAVTTRVTTRGAAHVVMPRVARHEADRALAAMGLPEDQARDLAGVARRSMQTLRRQLAVNPSLQVPEWAAPITGPALVPMLLLGQFDERRGADLQALEALTPSGLSAIRETLSRWSQEIDPPVRRVGNVWYLVSKEDAWALLSRYVSTEDLKRFANVASDILREVHPKFDLPPEERWAASIHGKERQYSSTLVTGVADTIALLGALGGSVTVQGGVAPAIVADRIVSDLFEAVAGDWRGWATLSPVLPLLAEGAPDVFLRAVDAQIASDEQAVKTLFADEGDMVFSSSSHTGLLWALEVLAWSPDHLAHAARILATLDRLDPGGRLTNRPRNSLRSIFLFWLPQTAANVDTRLDVLMQLGTREPEAAWRLFASLLPRLHDHSTNNPRPKWRDWGTAPHPTYGEMYRQTSALIGWMIENAGEQSARWVTLIEALDNVRPEDFDAITKALADYLDRVSDDGLRTPVFDALRELLSRHRSFPTADWALAPKRLQTIESLFDAATPRDAVARYRWLFSDRPQLPEGREEDWEAHQQLVTERRLEAVRELHSELGTDGVLRLASKVDRPDEMGRILALTGVIPAEDEDRFIERTLTAKEGAEAVFGRGYANGWTTRVGPDVALERIRNGKGSWSEETRGLLLLSHVPNAKTLDIVDSLEEGGQASFWSSVYPIWFDPPVLERGLRGLLEHGRAVAFVDAAALLLRKRPDIDPELLAEGLDQAARGRADKNGQRMDAHDVSELLNALERAVKEGRFDENRVAQLEFLYLPILDRFTRPPRILHRAMAKDPALFVDAVRSSYRARGEERTTLSDSDTQLAERAHHLIQTWRDPPGQTTSGIDTAVLNEWVDKARAELRAIGRAEIGDQLIGQVLSGAAVDSDRAWPVTPIRDLVERIKSDDFERGLEIGRYNSRGVITRNPSSGGDLERGEAEAYERMAGITAARWPRTSAMLRRMALEAHAQASQEDIDSELRQDLED